MANQSAGRDTLSIMFAKLTLVMLGFFVLILALVVVGYLGNAYYTAGEESKDLELAKQNAFAVGLKTEDFLRMELAAERISQETYDKYLAALAAEAGRGQAPPTQKPPPTPAVQPVAQTDVPDSPPVVPGQKTLAAPDLTITPADIEAMKGKAALIHTTVGTMVFELYPERAPATVKNFFYLAENGFYEGLYFHRSVPGMYIQAGSPVGRRGGTPGYWMDMEFNGIRPLVGMIGMVPPPEELPKTASEFVIFLATNDAYQDRSTIFGRIINRLDVAEKINDSWSDKDGYIEDRVYITKVEIADLEKVKPERDFWEDYGKAPAQ